MKPTVSIIIPAYNASKNISETIESIVTQSFSDFEVIVVDDGSTDNTKDIVLAYKDKDQRINYISQNNAGAPAARNKGLEASTGKFITMLDADDLWEKNKLEKQISVMPPANDAIVLTGVRTFEVVDGKRVWGAIIMPPNTENGRYEVSFILSLRSMQFYLFNTALIDRQTIIDLGGWNADKWTGEDWELWIRASRGSTFKTIEEPLQYYRKHSGSITRSHEAMMVLEAHEGIIREQFEPGYITEKEFEKALIRRQVETCGFFLYQDELVKAFQVFRRSLGLRAGWKSRAVWERGVEILRGALKRLTTAR